MSGQEKLPPALPAAYKMVDTCGAEFEAETPYFYSSPGNRMKPLLSWLATAPASRRRWYLVPSPIRIGQGNEFDYASVHCVMALKRAGYEVAIVNNNPETVSTDFNTGDRLYFDPLTPEDAMRVIEMEKTGPGVVVAFGGQTAIKLAKPLGDAGVHVFRHFPRRY